MFSVIQTVDSVELATRLDRLRAGRSRDGADADRVPILLQVNVDRDPAKAGIPPEDVEAMLDGIVGLDHLAVRGLMTVGRLVADPADARGTFVALRRLSERLRSTIAGLGPELSMGMTDDFEVAVEEGATIVRVGRAIFGVRPAPREHDAHGEPDSAPLR